MQTEDLSHCWSELVERPARDAGYRPPRLVVLASEYREFFGPFLDYLDKLAAEHRDRPIAVMLPEVVERRWYHLIFRHRTTLLKEVLLLRGGPQIMVITTPWYPRDALRVEDRLGSRRAAAASTQPAAAWSR